MSSATKVNEVVRHAADTTKHAAAATAHTLANLAGDAQEKLESLPLPTPARKRRSSRRRLLVVMAAAAAIAGVAKWVRTRGSATDGSVKDTDASVKDEAGSGPGGSVETPFTSVG